MADPKTVERLLDKAVEMRRNLLRLSHEAGTLHLGGDLSMTDLMTVIFEHLLHVDPADPEAPGRDRFVLSKGHGAGGLYMSMANRGFFDLEEIYATYAKLGTRFGVHPCRNHLPGVEASTGSLGHGLSIAVGMSLSARLNHAAHRIVTLLGDGELNEGSVWEAAMSAAHFRLGNLTAVIDKNELSMDGAVDDVMRVNPVGAKFAAFGWNVVEVDGHDIAALVDCVDSLPPVDSDLPTVVVAQTVKGKGIGFMENEVGWHAGTVDADTLQRCYDELDAARELQHGVPA
jgi:transketolase